MKLCAAFLACHVVFAYLPSVHTSWWPFWSTESTEQQETVEKSQEKVESRTDYDYYDEDYYYYDQLGLTRRTGDLYDQMGPNRRSGDYYYYYEDERVPNNRQADVGSTINPLAALIAPLAGLALLGAASAVAVNPMLLKLVTINRGNRRRRDIWDQDLEKEDLELKGKIKQLRVLETFLSRIPGKASQADLLTAGYLSCSGLGEDGNQCLEQLTCMYASNTTLNRIEKDVTSIVLYNLMSNKHLKPKLKKRLRKAARFGRDGPSCVSFSCSSLPNPELSPDLE